MWTFVKHYLSFTVDVSILERFFISRGGYSLRSGKIILCTELCPVITKQITSSKTFTINNSSMITVQEGS